MVALSGKEGQEDNGYEEWAAGCEALYISVPSQWGGATLADLQTSTTITPCTHTLPTPCSRSKSMHAIMQILYSEP